MRRSLSRLNPRTRRSRPGLELLEDRKLLATLTVNSTADASPGPDVLTLREAIELVDGSIALSSLSLQAQQQVSGSLSDPNTIAFDIPGPGVQTIMPSSVLPAIMAPVTINGYTQPGATPNTLTVGDNAILLIELDGENAGDAGSGPVGLALEGGNTTVEGLVINRFNNVGIHAADSGGDVIRGNFIGSDPTGTIDRGNAVTGIWLESGANDVIGGSAPADRNVISANKAGQVQAGSGVGAVRDVVIQGNYIGTDATGSRRLINNPPYASTGLGVVNATGAVIGGAVAGAGNVISGNNADGLDITDADAAATVGALVQGNFIGVDATGTKPVPNAANGVYLFSSGNTIGGTTPAARNVIAGNSPFYGVLTGDGAANNLVEGNFIGTGADGAKPMGNGVGIALQSAGNTVGGTAAGAGNVVANSLYQGIALDAGAVNTRILSNSISSNARGGITDYLKNGGNAPAVTLAVAGRTSTQIVGTLDNAPGARFTIQFFANTALDDAGQAEGQRYLGSAVVTTAANGRAVIDATLPVRISPGQWVTATASTPGQNTTVFSAGIRAVAPISTGTTLAAKPIASRGGRVYSFLLTASVAGTSPGGSSPTGSITFTDGSTRLATVPLDASGHASFVTPTLQPGVHHFTASYSGDGVFAPSTSNSLNVVSQDVPPVVLLAQRGPGRGRSTLALSFSETLGPASATDISNYEIVPVRALGNGRTVAGRALRIRSATMSPSGDVVTLALAQPLRPASTYRLTVRGTAPGGVTDSAGTLLDGNGSGAPGTDAMVVLPPVLPNAHPRRRHR